MDQTHTDVTLFWVFRWLSRESHHTRQNPGTYHGCPHHLLSWMVISVGLMWCLLVLCCLNQIIRCTCTCEHIFKHLMLRSCRFVTSQPKCEILNANMNVCTAFDQFSFISYVESWSCWFSVRFAKFTETREDPRRPAKWKLGKIRPPAKTREDPRRPAKATFGQRWHGSAVC